MKGGGGKKGIFFSMTDFGGSKQTNTLFFFNFSYSDTLGHWDARGLSAADPRLRQWISVLTMPKNAGMPS